LKQEQNPLAFARGEAQFDQDGRTPSDMTPVNCSFCLTVAGLGFVGVHLNDLRQTLRCFFRTPVENERALKLPTAQAEGFLQSFELSPSCDGASFETCKTLKPTGVFRTGRGRVGASCSSFVR
jgi:hypothetical protein